MWQEVQLVNDKTGSHTQSTFLLVVKVFLGPSRVIWAFLVAQMVKNPPALQETQVQSLGWEDTLEKGMTTHSSILAWKIPWAEEPTVHGIAKSLTQLNI